MYIVFDSTLFFLYHLSDNHLIFHSCVCDLIQSNENIMKLSFIIPALNEQKNIRNCVASIISQLEEGDEVIVVDNGSRDKTVEIAKKNGARVVRESKKGISNARNRGAREARGDILCFIDADGIVTPNWSRYVRKSLIPGVQAVVGMNVFEHKNKIKMIWYNSYTVVAHVSILLQEIFLRRTFLTGNNIAIRKSVFSKLGGFEPIVGEDYWLSRKFWKLPNSSGVFVPRMVVWYSSRGFDASGFLHTIFYWLANTFKRADQSNYSYKNKKIT